MASTASTASKSKPQPSSQQHQRQQQVAESSMPRKKRKASNASASLESTQSSKQEERKLPCKKRKGSNATTSSSEGKRSLRSNTGETITSAHSGGSAPNTAAAKLSDSRLPSKKRKDQLRKGSYDLLSSASFGDDLALRIRKGSNDDSASSMLLPQRKSSNDESMGMEDLLSLGGGNPPEPLPNEIASVNGKTSNTSSSALDHLDALGKKSPTRKTAASPSPAAAAAAKQKTGTDGDSSCSNETFASSGHRILMEAILMSGQTASDKSGSTAATAAKGIDAATLPNPTPVVVARERKDSFTAATRDRLDSFARERSDSFAAVAAAAACRRDRLESWGAMSDLSAPLGTTTTTTGADSSSAAALAAVAAATNLQQYHHHYYYHQQHGINLMDDPDDPAVAAAVAAIAYENDDRKPSAVPSRISLHQQQQQQRDRLNSVASLSETSVSNNLPLVHVVDGGMDIQAFVAAAMASVGDQLAELAGAIESVAERAAEGVMDDDDIQEFKREMGMESDASDCDDDDNNNNNTNDGDDDNDEASSTDAATASPMIGAVSDGVARRKEQRRPRSGSTGSGKISVDYNAVKAAVDAAEAASGTLGLAKNNNNNSKGGKKKAVAPPPPPPPPPPAIKSSVARGRRQLPLRGRASSGSQASSNSDERHSEGRDTTVRGRARAAAGYVQPRKGGPIKKRAKRNSPETAVSSAVEEKPTPKVSNRSIVTVPKEVPVAPLVVSSSSSVAAAAASSTVKPVRQAGPPNQKWELMFTCLLEFAKERRAEETKNMTQEEKSNWTWDGNVPTTYKTKDGKALGRWVNNQRSAKSKGALREDREQRLIDAGLKWSVLTSNCWNEMLQELEIYIKDQAKQGKTWDGNVPTNYQIKTRPNGGFNGEDKNLGRWVNRQRSLYQAGKLRKDRQLALDKIGLKWSMLATTSWDSMYETLEEYVNERKREHGEWDGNVPANYRTNDSPPRALGRWINRQRSAYMKKKLKREYVDKLNSLGLKWSVHQRHENGEIVLDEGESEREGQDGEPNGSNGENSSGKENSQVESNEQIAEV